MEAIPNFNEKYASPAPADSPVPATAGDETDARALFCEQFDTLMATRYRAARDARAVIEKEMLADQRRRDGEYDPEILEKLTKAGGSKVFDNITDTKCAGIESLMVDMMAFSGERPWGLDPTPIPELSRQAEEEAILQVVEAAMAAGQDPAAPDYQDAFDRQVGDLKQQIESAIESAAKERAEGMERLIADQFDEGGFDEALDEFINDLATHKVAALMGPCPVMETQMVVDGTTVRYEKKLLLKIRRISPFHLYPEHLATKPGDGDFFIREPVTPDFALGLKNIPGVRKDRLTQALAHPGGMSAGDDSLDLEAAQLATHATGGDQATPTREHELVHFWHRMSAKDVAAFRGEESAPEENVDSELIPMTGLMLNGVVIKVIENLDKTGKPNVFIASYRKRAGSFWGLGGSGLAKSQQEQVNVFARALNNNANLSSKPRQLVDTDLLVYPMQANEVFPGQSIHVKRNPNDARKAIEILETPNYTQYLLAARNQAASWLDEKSGIFPQSYGSPKQSGPAETLGGYQLLRADQTKTIKRALVNVSNAIGGLVRAFWLWNMNFHADESVKGDFQVVARGPVQSYITAEDADQMMAILELIQKNPALATAVKPGAAAKLLREVMKLKRIPQDGILKDESEIEAEFQAAQAATQEEQAGENLEPNGMEGVEPEKESDLIRAQADQIRAQAAADKVELDRERVALQRAETLQRIRNAQQELAARRAFRGLGPSTGALPETIPTMGGAA